MNEPNPNKRTRSALLIVSTALALVAVSCAASADEGPRTTTPATAAGSTVAPGNGSTSEQPAVGAFPVGPSALQSMNAEEFPDSLVDTGEIISGGPPPDGIPPIDEPTFLDAVDNLSILPGEEAVVAVVINGDARAYPIRAMIWHEIVNDTVGGVPVSVTYCPLCNSAATYERTINGNVTTFGTSGRLFASALVMYDRATESLWTHFDGTAVVGMLAGTELTSVPSPLLSWDDFVANYPTGKVLDWQAAGFARDYGRNPYSGYDTPDGIPFLFRGSLDDRGAAMQRVVGIDIDDQPVAYAVGTLTDGEAYATPIEVAGQDLVILWKAGQASALEGNEIGNGRDVGSVGVFSPVVGGDVLSFTAQGSAFVDHQTSTVWSITGRAIEGPLAGEQLTAVPHLDTFWFAWSTYKPGTALISE